MKTYRAFILFALASALAWGQSPWTVTADAAKNAVTISHSALGVVVKDVRLNVRGSGGLAPVEHWTVEARGERGLVFESESPKTAWKITAADQLLVVTCTPNDVPLPGPVPAAPQRIVARLMDPAGTPVDWVGTDEVKGGYGGRKPTT